MVCYRMAYETIICLHCSSEHVVKNGKTSNKKQKYLCKACRKQFIRDYTYNGCKSWIQDLIIPMTLNSSGIRDITRVLKISSNTVLKTIRQEAGKIPEMPPESRAIERVEIDEQWSYVQNKRNQQWLLYVWDRANKKVVYYVIGKRTDASCKKLLTGIKACQIEDYYTDNWQSYRKLIPASKHFISKKNTQSIERNNLNFRTHLKRLHRRTICFSKSKDMPEAVIKL